MCLDRISIGDLIMRGMLSDAFAVVADVSILAGFVSGGAVLWIAADLVRAAYRSRRYSEWKEARNAD